MGFTRGTGHGIGNMDSRKSRKCLAKVWKVAKHHNRHELGNASMKNPASISQFIKI